MKQFSQLVKPASILFAVAVLFSGCSGDVDPANNVTVSFKGTNETATASSTARMAAEGLAVTEALIGLEDIKLKQQEHDEYEDDEYEGEEHEGEEHEGDEHEEDDSEALKYDFEGPYVIDLLAATSTPEIPVATIEPGVYHKLKAELATVLDNGASVSIKGTFTAADGTETPVSFVYSGTEDFKVINSKGIEVTAADLNSIAVLFDFNAWFAGIDFASATVNENGEVIIDKDNNKNLYDIIESNLEHAAKMHHHDDDDEDDDDDDDDHEEDEHDEEEEKED